MNVFNKFNLNDLRVTAVSELKRHRCLSSLKLRRVGTVSHSSQLSSRSGCAHFKRRGQHRGIPTKIRFNAWRGLHGAHGDWCRRAHLRHLFGGSAPLAGRVTAVVVVLPLVPHLVLLAQEPVICRYSGVSGSRLAML